MGDDLTVAYMTGFHKRDDEIAALREQLRLAIIDQANTEAEANALRARLALLEKVAEAAIAGPCRHTSGYKGTDCPLCAALDAAKEG